MANGNTSKNWNWLFISLAVTAGILLAGYLFFPDLVAKFTTWVVGLLFVVTGLIFRKKR